MVFPVGSVPRLHNEKFQESTELLSTTESSSCSVELRESAIEGD
jgi:hypothetical protein